MNAMHGWLLVTDSALHPRAGKEMHLPSGQLEYRTSAIDY